MINPRHSKRPSLFSIFHSAILKSPLRASRQLSPLPARPPSQDGALLWSLYSCAATEYQDDLASAVFSSHHCPTSVYIGSLGWKFHSRAFKPCRQNMANTASLGPQGHKPSTPGILSALPGSLCVPGAWLTSRGTPGLTNTCLHDLQVDPCPPCGQELLSVQGAQGGCRLGGQGPWLSLPLLPPQELFMKLPPEDAPGKPLLPQIQTSSPWSKGHLWVNRNVCRHPPPHTQL